MNASDSIRRDALFSECRRYRYTLERYWCSEKPLVLFILLNPSTADAERDDPTSRRGMGFARMWGFEACVFVNAFAYRSTNPREMKRVIDPIGPENDRIILEWCDRADMIVAAWGNHGVHRGRDIEMMKLLRGYPVHAFGATRLDQPRHILYLPRDARTERWL